MKYQNFAAALASFPGAAEQQVFTMQVARVDRNRITHSADALALVDSSPGRVIILEVRSAENAHLGYVLTSDAIGSPHIAVYPKGSAVDLSPSQKLQLIARASSMLLEPGDFDSLVEALWTGNRERAAISLQQAIVNRLLEA